MAYATQGWFTDPIAIVLVLDKWSLSRKSALLSPYDTVTWSLTLVSILVVSVVLATILIFDVHSESRRWRTGAQILLEGCFLAVQLLLMVLGAIIEQNPKEKTCRKVVPSFRVLFIVWLLASLVISNGYTGIIISFMCTTFIPKDLPKDVKRLLFYTKQTENMI